MGSRRTLGLTAVCQVDVQNFTASDCRTIPQTFKRHPSDVERKKGLGASLSRLMRDRARHHRERAFPLQHKDRCSPKRLSLFRDAKVLDTSPRPTPLWQRPISASVAHVTVSAWRGKSRKECAQEGSS